MNPFTSSHIKLVVKTEMTAQLQSSKSSTLDRAKFRQLCHEHGLSATRQRAIIYAALMSMPGHPTPEDVFTRVRPQLPSLSLATVYKTLHAFVEAGIVHEMTPHQGSLRVDANPAPHHHFVCTACHKIMDVDSQTVEPIRLRNPLPTGVRVDRFELEIHGLCESCAQSNPISQ